MHDHDDTPDGTRDTADHDDTDTPDVPRARRGRHDNPAPVGPRGQRSLSAREQARRGGTSAAAASSARVGRPRAGTLIAPPTPRPAGASDPAMAAKNAQRAADRAAARGRRAAARPPRVIEKSGGGGTPPARDAHDTDPPLFNETRRALRRR